MNIKNRLVKTALAALLITPAASAATIVWQSSRAITGDTDVRTDGTLVGAYKFAGSGTTTLNGVPFAAAAANATQGNVTTSGANYGYTGFGGGSNAPFSLLSPSYRTVLSSGLYSSTNAITVNLSGLTAGQTYLVQFWANDSRGLIGTGQRDVRVASGTNASPNVKPMIPIETPGAVGQYVIGHLTLGPAETTASFTVDSPIPSGRQINALQVRTSNRSAWMSDAKYGIYLNFAPGGPLPSPLGPTGYSDFAQVPVGGQTSPWSDAVAAFDVDGFANQAAEAGAGYVILTLGFKHGYYCAPNTTFENIGGLSPGEYTSQRDLVKDLADALRPKGIKLMLYVAGEGPWEANALYRKSDRAKIEMRKLTFANVYPVTPNGMAYLAAFRSNFNAMISEWSTRWGSRVSGWWFDGCWTATGYGAVSDNNDGPGNLAALIAAAKAGNPDSMVAVNPGADKYNALSAAQDYIAGECGQHYTQYGKFSQYPGSPFVNYGGKDVRWHTLSFLGVTWRTNEQKYVNEELINYISSINRLGGFVTMDVGYNANGLINPVHLNQLKRIKSALNPSAIPPVPYDEAPTFVNLALYKPAYLKSNGAGNPALGPASEQYQAHAGVDGDFSTKAQAGGQYPWNYTVDLEAMKDFDRIAVHFHAPNYATSYQILYSANGLPDAAGNWQHLSGTATNYSASAPGTYIHNAGATRNGRYIRIIALQPSGSGQPGGSMALSEFEVFNIAGTAQTSKDTVWVDEYAPAGATTSSGGSGSWNWAGLLDTNWSSQNLPYPAHGLRVHWSPAATGWSEHSFDNAQATLKTGANDHLYCDVWIDPASPTSEIMLIWKDSTGVNHRAYWGGDHLYNGGEIRTRINDLPAAGSWVRLAIPASTIGAANKTLVGLNYAIYNGRVVFDRAGRTTVPGYTENAPQVLTATPGNGQVSLKWNPVIGATSYNIKVGLTQGGPYTSLAASVSGTEYLDTSLTNGTTYYYVVTANVGGVPGPDSPEAKAKPMAP